MAEIKKYQNRRRFIFSFVLVFSTILSEKIFAGMKTKKAKQITHHVFFWLKNPGSKDDLNKLIEGLKTLEDIPSVREFHVGVPAKTKQRDVVESTFSVSELIFFDTIDGQNSYQDHPVHKKFVEECSHLWDKVVVYDSKEV